MSPKKKHGIAFVTNLTECMLAKYEAEFSACFGRFVGGVD